MVDGPVLWGTPVRSREPGVFLVEIATSSEAAPIDIVAVRTWVDHVPGLRMDGERPTPTAVAERLSRSWLPGQTVLYVGRTLKSLGARVGALYATPLGERRPHPGGHWLKTLRGVDKLRVWWAVTEAAEEYEDALLTAFAESIDPAVLAKVPAGDPLLPFANLESPTGGQRQHGLTGSLTDSPAETPAPGRGATARSIPVAAKRAQTTTRRSPATPRGAAVPRAASARSGARTATQTGAPRPAPTRLSAEGLERLHAELEDLRVEQRPQVIKRVAAARALGDLRENADYEAARNEQSFLEGRIRTLEAMLVNAEVIVDEHTGEIRQGTTVELDHEGERITYRIVGSAEASPAEGRISDASPVGKALIGHRAGDEVDIHLPGRTLRYRVVEVR